MIEIVGKMKDFVYLCTPNEITKDKRHEDYPT